MTPLVLPPKASNVLPEAQLLTFETSVQVPASFLWSAEVAASEQLLAVAGMISSRRRRKPRSVCSPSGPLPTAPARTSARAQESVRRQ